MLRRLLASLVLLGLCVSAAAQDATVNTEDRRQNIDGFCTADLFLDVLPLTDAEADQLFDVNAGIGLSILRVGIDPTGGIMSFYDNARKAAARGAKIIATPLTAPGAQKDNGTEENGGHLFSANYSDWATKLAAFQGLLQANAGANLYALQVQNEPDFTATYWSMLYTNAEMVAFLKILGPQIAALTPRPKIVLPDVADWSLAGGFASAVLADGTASPYFDIIGTHQYAGVSSPATTARPYWQTEFSTFDPFDGSIGNAVTYATSIHTGVTTGNVSAWCTWWQFGQTTDNEGLIGSSNNRTITKRYYAVGNFSKFIRPGAVRVGVTGGPSSVDISAFRGPGNGKAIVVAVNHSGSTASFNITLTGLSPATLTPYVTSATQDLAALAPITGSSNVFAVSLPNNTVTTFVGTVAVPARMRKIRLR